MDGRSSSSGIHDLPEPLPAPALMYLVPQVHELDPQLLLLFAQPAFAALQFDPHHAPLQNQTHIRPTWSQQPPSIARLPVALNGVAVLFRPSHNPALQCALRLIGGRPGLVRALLCRQGVASESRPSPLEVSFSFCVGAEGALHHAASSIDLNSPPLSVFVKSLTR